MAKSFNNQDEFRTFAKGKVEVIKLINILIGKAILIMDLVKLCKKVGNHQELSGFSHSCYFIRKNEGNNG
jgi:hypothetical protein